MVFPFFAVVFTCGVSGCHQIETRTDSSNVSKRCGVRHELFVVVPLVDVLIKTSALSRQGQLVRQGTRGSRREPEGVGGTAQARDAFSTSMD